MLEKNEIIQRIIKPGIIAVVRARSRAQAIPIAEALLAGGVIAVEITMTTPNAIEAIRDVSQQFGDSILAGVGTVLDVDTAQAALDAGAKFVVSPIMRPALVRVAHAAGAAVMLGAYTPTEAQLAHEAGSDFVKIFPAEGLGISYIKSLRAPLPHLRIVPTGGIDVQNAASFLKAGCAALGVGSSLISPQILQDNDWPGLEKIAAQFIQAVQS